MTWALANIAFSRVPSVLTPFLLTTLKSLIALALIMLTLAATEHRVYPELDQRATIYLAISGFIGITIGDLMYFNMLVRLGPRRSIFSSTLVPPLSAVAAYFAFGESLSPLQLAGVLLALAGVTIVLLQNAPADPAKSERGRFVLGLVFGAGAVTCQVAANILTKEVAGSHSALAISAARLLFGSIGLVAAAVIARRMFAVFRPLADRRTAVLVFIATVMGSYFGIWFYMAGIMYTSVGIAVTLSSMSPIFDVALSHFFFGERATARSLMGAVISVCGVALLFAG